MARMYKRAMRMRSKFRGRRRAKRSSSKTYKVRRGGIRL